MRESRFSYRLEQSEEGHEINSVWDKEVWTRTRSITLENYMGDYPSHFPETRLKVRYDKDRIYVIFKVMDRYVRAVEKKTHGRVWEDSCVEFFFSPGPDSDRGYFNLEVNCKGVFLFQYHLDDGKKGFVSEKDSERIEIAHSLTADVEEEYHDSLTWTVEYSLPIDILSNYMEVDEPGPGVEWRANFYKCADKTSHPHWLTWAPVDYPTPRFHLPEFFGSLEFQ